VIQIVTIGPARPSDPGVSRTEPRAFLSAAEVEAFWDGARRDARPDQATGYLTDAWPAEVAARRFAGELRALDRWLRRFGVRRERCLDVGCGTGAWLEELAARFTHAEGIDLSAEMVASARARLAAHGIANARVAHVGIADLPAAAERDRYDLIFVGGVLMYLDDDALADVLARLRRLLAPGGVLLLRESTYTGRTRYRDKPLSRGLFGDAARATRPYRAIYRPLGEYRRRLARAGLVVEATRANTSYLRAEVASGELLAIDRVTFGALRRSPRRAEAAARWLHRLGALALWPAVLVRPVIAFAWRLANHWIVCRAAPDER
jgi:SAM-dependent methyltransferase